MGSLSSVEVFSDNERRPNAQEQQRPDNDGIKGLVFGLLPMATDPTALLSRWLLLGVEFPLNTAQFLFGVACHDLILAGTLADGKCCWGLVLHSLGGPAQKRFGNFGGFSYGNDQHCRTVLRCNLRRGQLQQGEPSTKRCKYWSSVSEMETGGTVVA